MTDTITLKTPANAGEPATLQIQQLDQTLQERLPSHPTFRNALQWELNDLLSRWSDLTNAVDHLSGLDADTAEAATQAYHAARNNLDTVDDRFLNAKQIKNIVYQAITGITDHTARPGYMPLLRICSARLQADLETMLANLDKTLETTCNDDFRLTLGMGRHQGNRGRSRCLAPRGRRRTNRRRAARLIHPQRSAQP